MVGIGSAPPSGDQRARREERRHIKSKRRIGSLSAGNAAASLDRSYSCCVVAEETGYQSTEQPIAAQTSGPSQAGPGGLLFTSNIKKNIYI